MKSVKRSSKNGKETGSDDFFSVIVFDLVGTKFAVDLDQVSEISEYHSPSDLLFPLIQLTETVLFPGKDLEYKSPKLLKIKDENYYGVLIDQPEGIIHLTIEKIMAFPKLLVKAMKSSPLWGAFMLKEEMVFLLDCYKLNISQRTSDK